MGVARKFPEILNDEKVGKAAKDLWNDAQKMLERLKKIKSYHQVL